MYKRINNGIIMRSKAKWVEEEGKEHLTFFEFIKKKLQQCLFKLIPVDETDITKPEDVINEQKLFYQNLHNSKYQPNRETLQIEEDFKIIKISQNLIILIRHYVNIIEPLMNVLKH